MTQTYTYATLGISKAAYEEIRDKLQKVGYAHAFKERRRRLPDPPGGYEKVVVIDMHGIALESEE